MAEFTVKTDLAPVTSLVIEANFDEIKNELAAKVAAYEKMVVTPEGVAAAKSDLATLRRVSKQIDEVRLAWKREYMKPMDAFEAKCKELKSVVSGGIENLDGQIKGFERQEVEAKLRDLEAVFDEQVAKQDVEGYVTFEKIRLMHPKWVNKGYSATDAKNDVIMDVTNVRRGINALRGYPEEYRTALLDAFKERLDMADVVTKYARLMEIKAQEMRREQERKDEAERRQEEIRKIAEAKEKSEQPPTEPEPEPEELLVRDFRVWATRSQLNALGAWLRENGLRYGRVPKEVKS